MTAEVIYLGAEVLFRLAHGDFVDAVGFGLGLAATAWPLTVALEDRGRRISFKTLEMGSRRAARTFARFFRHSVQALGVTTPRPRRRLLSCADDDAVPLPCDPEAEPACGVLPALGTLGPEWVWLLLSSSRSIESARGMAEACGKPGLAYDEVLLIWGGIALQSSRNDGSWKLGRRSAMDMLRGVAGAGQEART